MRKLTLKSALMTLCLVAVLTALAACSDYTPYDRMTPAQQLEFMQELNKVT